jgi:hypothetical protein
MVNPTMHSCCSMQRRWIGKACLLYLLFSCFSTIPLHPVKAQAGSFDVGLRFQKTLNLYHENGLTAHYFSHQRVAWGGSYVSSRLGSAIGSNAIKQDNLFLSGAYYFRPKRRLKSFIRANAGWFFADYEVNMFDQLPNTSPLLSVESGVSFPVFRAIHLNTSLGYNLITGNGFKRPGTLFPLFYQVSMNWRIHTPDAK